jgi:NitT/TauT family transport system substrate-binding protein
MLGFRRLAAQFLGAALTLGIGAAHAQTAPINMRLTLDWAPQPHQSPWFLAAERGYFAREGLNVSIDRGFGSGDAMAKIAAGSYDIGLGDPNLLVQWNTANPNAKLTTVFLYMDRGMHAMVTLKSTGIAKLSDLAGKKIAHPPGDIIRPMWGVLARLHNIDSSRIEWLTVQPNLRDALLARGGADAVTAFASTTYFNLLSLGQKPEDIVLFPLSENGFELFGNGLLVTNEYARRNPEAIRRFVRATLAGMRDSLSDVPAAVQSVIRRDPTANAQIETDRFRFMIERAIVTPHVRAQGISVVEPARLAQLNTFLTEAFGLPAAPPPGELYTADFLPPVGERQVPR